MFTPPSPVVELEGGARHVLARLQNGQVYAWGSDESGQLGFPSAAEGGRRLRPARLRGDAHLRAVAQPRRRRSPPAKPTASPSKKKKAGSG